MGRVAFPNPRVAYCFSLTRECGAFEIIHKSACTGFLVERRKAETCDLLVLVLLFLYGDLSRERIVLFLGVLICVSEDG
ncbi:hypothetical protein VNO77_43547 [Canavalia gladiata]|uniref:Uncharacterized protein n=1 Tax=Canavalia gladiata TaxID=3824 RepID=A0AAN9JUA3_CANGL